jgi:hypothetical protein
MERNTCLSAKLRLPTKWLIPQLRSVENLLAMITLLFYLFRLLPFLLGGHRLQVRPAPLAERGQSG